jgi:glucosamine--fructose-6-phosphate aminotransferase (isomerizing)
VNRATLTVPSLPMSEMPELRPGPPWAMEEMIFAEPELVGPILSAPAAAQAAALIRAAADAGEPIVVPGCGTSAHAALAGAALLAEALPDARRPPLSRDAFEATLAPETGGVLIAISHEAGTAATLAALREGGARGATTILVTGLPERAPGGLALVYGTPLRDTSWCHTVGYLSPLLALVAIAARVAGAEPDAAAAERVVRAQLADRAAFTAAAGRLAGCERLLVCAGGADEVTARELSLKVEEGLHLPATPLGLEKILHGHLPATDARTGLVLLRADRRAAARRDARARDVLAATAVLGLPSVTIGLEGPDTSGLSPVAGALIAGGLAAQLLTIELVLAAGTNPDLIRREQDLYRDSAAAAEGRTAHLDP